jgi:hypothetical protein
VKLVINTSQFLTGYLEWYDFGITNFLKTMTNNQNSLTTGADAVDIAIDQGIDFDGSPIPTAKLELYKKVMELENGRQRSGVSNTMRSRIVRIGVKHIAKDELNKLLIQADFTQLKEKEIAFYYG